MPALKSPAQILKLWKKATTDFLGLNNLAALASDEENWNKKTIKGLERLRKLAKNRSMAQRVDPIEFGEARNDTLTPMGKLRKLVKPRKSQAKVKKYYLGVCQLILLVQKLVAEELEDNDLEPAADVLSDVDGEELDRREDGQATAPEPPPPPPPPTAATPPPAAPPPPAGEAEVRFNERLARLTPAVELKKTATPAVANDLKVRFSAAELFGRKKDFTQANTMLDLVEAILRQPASENGADAEAGRFNDRLKKLLPKVVQSQAVNPAGFNDLRMGISEAQVFARQKDFAQANARLDQLEKALGQPSGNGAASPPPAAAKPGAAPAIDLTAWTATLNSVAAQIRALRDRFKKSTHPEAPRAVVLLDSAVKNLTPQPTTRQQVLELDRYLKTDDVISDIGLFIDARNPLLQALGSLKSQLQI